MKDRIGRGLVEYLQKLIYLLLDEADEIDMGLYGEYQRSSSKHT